MPLPSPLTKVRLPVLASPLFIVSGPDLVIAQCRAGVIGSFPALNARPEPVLEEWLQRIGSALAGVPGAAPFAVNQIVHKSNARLQHDIDLCVKYQVPVIITSLGAHAWVNDAIHSYGGIVLHDVTSVAHAKKALERGADGLIAVCAGAGGHAGTLSPFALVQEIRKFFDGPLLLSGAIANGGAVLAAQAMGADMAYIGSAFIATREANADPRYKQMLVDGSAEDIMYTDVFTGVSGNYLRPSVVAAGLDPANLPINDGSTLNIAAGGDINAKAWKDIWGCGQGIGAVESLGTVAGLVDRLEREYRAARLALAVDVPARRAS